jgi:hypothetical protein
MDVWIKKWAVTTGSYLQGESMPAPSLKLERIDASTLLKVLDGVQGPISIKVVIDLPTEAGHESNSIRVYSDHNCIQRLKLMILSLGEKGDLELPIFNLALSEHLIQSAFTIENVEEIKAPTIDPQKWEKLSTKEKQKLLLKTVQQQLLCNLGELSSRLQVARSHVSNVLNGKRNLGWKAFNNLLGNFPLSMEMQELVKSTMLGVRKPNE